jgi:hypothetical protein
MKVLNWMLRLVRRERQEEPKTPEPPKWNYFEEGVAPPQRGQAVTLAVMNGNMTHPMYGLYTYHEGEWTSTEGKPLDCLLKPYAWKANTPDSGA